MKNRLLKSLLIIGFLFSLSFGVFSNAYAEESVVLDATLSSKTTQKLKERIEKIVEEKKDKIKGIIDNIDSNKQGFIGEVTRISEESITVKTNKSTRILPITEDVEIIKAGKEVELSDIAVENWLVVMGIIEDDNFIPIRILVSTETLRPDPTHITIGSITQIERNELTVSPRSGEEPQAITLNSNTLYEDLNGEEISRTDIEDETQALIIAVEDEDEKTARRVKILTIIQEDE